MKLSACFLTVCCVATVFTACKKDDNENDKDTPAQKTLKAGKWQVTASILTATYNGKDTSKDVFSEIEDCEKDDYIIFVDNGKANLDQNALKCPGYDQIQTFAWGLLNNDTRLYIIDANPDTMDVVELTSSQLKLRINQLTSSGDPISNTRTFKNVN